MCVRVRVLNLLHPCVKIMHAVNMIGWGQEKPHHHPDPSLRTPERVKYTSRKNVRASNILFLFMYVGACVLSHGPPFPASRFLPLIPCSAGMCVRCRQWAIEHQHTSLLRSGWCGWLLAPDHTQRCRLWHSVRYSFVLGAIPQEDEPHHSDGDGKEGKMAGKIALLYQHPSFLPSDRPPSRPPLISRHFTSSPPSASIVSPFFSLYSLSSASTFHASYPLI